jgi:hypothetical protein
MNLGALLSIGCELLALLTALVATAANITAWQDYRLIEAAGVDGLWKRTTQMAIRRSALRAAVKWILFYAVIDTTRMEVQLLVTLALALLMVVLLIEQHERTHWMRALDEVPQRGTIARGT